MKTFLVKEITTTEKCYTVEAEHKFNAENNFLKGKSKRTPECDIEEIEFDFIELAAEK